MKQLYDLFLKANGKVSTDSRRIESGALFFALKGDTFDGNIYAHTALNSGASVAVVDNAKLDDGSGRFFVVLNVLTALQDLARYHRSVIGIPIIALTGSNGKTTTKEFLKLALSVKFNVDATLGNLNNHIGVPLTLLSFTGVTQIGIVEMGASHVGEIAALCDIARPNAGLITNIGRAHLEGFGGADGVRKGKGELFDFLQSHGGTAIYNAKDDTLSAMVAERKGLSSIAYNPDAETIHLKIYGLYNVANAAAAVAASAYFEVDHKAAVKAVESYKPTNNRSQIISTTSGNTIVADCYNANPSSMTLAVEQFIASDFQNKVAILGDMKELGVYEDEEHKKIVELTSPISQCYFVGEIFTRIGAPNSYKDMESLAAKLKITKSTILLKGSHSIGLEKLIEIL